MCERVFGGSIKEENVVFSFRVRLNFGVSFMKRVAGVSESGQRRQA